MSLFLLAVAPLPAAEPMAALRACADERDDQRRLACYDAEVARMPGTAESAVAAGEPEESSQASAGKSRLINPRSGNGADAVEQFGMTAELARIINEQGGGQALDSIAAVVTRIDEQPYGERIVYLDNGQVWEEISRNRNLRLAAGDGITVKSAALGSFKLIGPGGKRFTRVKRIR